MDQEIKSKPLIVHAPIKKKLTIQDGPYGPSITIDFEAGTIDVKGEWNKSAKLFLDFAQKVLRRDFA